jgi:SRSO17 transposase
MREQDGVERRFQQYADLIVSKLGHVDREEPASLYLRGLLLPGERKSVEPMAVRLRGDTAGETRQSLGHFVSNSPWEDEPLIQVVNGEVFPAIERPGELAWIIVDDTGHRKKGKKSVGVARQYFGLAGKVENCQVAVSVSFATERGSIPVGYRLYLPEEWAYDMDRRREAGVPENTKFQTKNEIARDLIDAAAARGMPRGIVLGDAAYGDDADLRDGLTEDGYLYAVAVREHTTVWYGKYQPATPEPQTLGRPRTRLLRDPTHQPISVSDLARELPRSSWQTIAWREGTNDTLSSRFARVLVKAASDNKARQEEWLLIEWPEGDEKPAHFYLSTLPESITFDELVRHAKGRWRIERDYQELKSELGLSHYEGRGWRGFHHHATLCIAAYGFLVMERQRTTKIPDLDMKNLPTPDPSTRGRKQRHVPWSIATLRRRLASVIAAEIACQTLRVDVITRRIIRDKIADLVLNL